MRNLKVTVNGVEYDVQVEEVSKNNQQENINENKSLKTHIEDKKQTKPEINTSKNNDKSKVSSDSEKVCAPMPGTIVDILVNEEQQVKKGDVLLILEAMKMENEITSPIDGVVESISVNKGQSVETGENLIYIK